MVRGREFGRGLGRCDTSMRQDGRRVCVICFLCLSAVLSSLEDIGLGEQKGRSGMNREIEDRYILNTKIEEG